MPISTNEDDSNNQHLLSFMSDTVICAMCVGTHLSFTMISHYIRAIDIESSQNISTACFSSLLSVFFLNKVHQYLLHNMSSEYSFNIISPN